MNRRWLLLGGLAAAATAASAVAWRESTGALSDYTAYASRLRAPLGPDPALADLVRAAALAANGHNTQPWRFALSQRAIRISADPARRTPAVDPDDHHLHVSLGCAAENLAIAAGATGRPGELGIGANGAAEWRYASGPSRDDPRLAAIGRRQSTRTDYDGRPIPAEILSALARAGAEPGVRLILLTERRRIDAVRDLVVAGSDAQMADPAFVAELRLWMRFNPRDAMRAGDGLFAATSGAPVLPAPLGALAFSAFFTAAGERDKYARQLASTPAVAVFVAEAADPPHWVRVGRACQRFCLAATLQGLKLAFVNQPVEVASLRPALAALIGEPGMRPDLVLRIGYGPSAPFSPRRAAAAVIEA